MDGMERRRRLHRVYQLLARLAEGSEITGQSGQGGQTNPRPAAGDARAGEPAVRRGEESVQSRHASLVTLNRQGS